MPANIATIMSKRVKCLLFNFMVGNIGHGVLNKDRQITPIHNIVGKISNVKYIDQLSIQLNSTQLSEE